MFGFHIKIYSCLVTFNEGYFTEFYDRSPLFLSQEINPASSVLVSPAPVSFVATIVIRSAQVVDLHEHNPNGTTLRIGNYDGNVCTWNIFLF